MSFKADCFLGELVFIDPEAFGTLSVEPMVNILRELDTIDDIIDTIYSLDGTGY